jgi:hypothetical protein
MLSNISKILLIIGLIISSFSCSTKTQNNPKPNSEMPPKILWAWEREEDLRFLDVKNFGVAFLAQTLFLEADETIYKPRRQPLKLAPETYLIAVTRIETSRENAKRAVLSDEQKIKVAGYIKKTLELPNIKAVQIDFDALSSERNFYRNLVLDLKKDLPENFPLSITALGSWCVGDVWFGDFPVTEAVPMLFDMGADDKTIREFLSKENDWNESLCRASYGVSIDEPLKVNFKPNRRFYYFKSRSWSADDLERLKENKVF